MSSSKIVSVKGREIIDSRGNPTVEVDIHLEEEALVELQFPVVLVLGSMRHGS